MNSRPPEAVRNRYAQLASTTIFIIYFDWPMSTIAPRRLAGKLTIIAASAIGSVVVAGIGAGVLALLIAGFGTGGGCAASTGGGAGPIALGPPGTGALVGASEYGGPGDPSSGHVGGPGRSGARR